MSLHAGSRTCYVKGCRQLECRVANAVYEKLRRYRHLHQLPVLGAIVNGRETSRMLASLTNEGYAKGWLALVLGISWRTQQRHVRSFPVRVGTVNKVLAFWERAHLGAVADLDPRRRKIAELMLNSLARDWRTEGQTFQQIRPWDDDS